MNKRFFKLINNDIVFGECETVQTESGSTEILIKTPFTAMGGNIMPYMAIDMGSAPGAIQIHPMNILWSVPLDEFPEALKIYEETLSGVITVTKPSLSL